MSPEDDLTPEEVAECDRVADMLTEIFEQSEDAKECAAHVVGSVASLDPSFCLHCLIESVVVGRECATGQWDQEQLEYAFRCFARVIAGMLSRVPGDAGRAQMTDLFARDITYALQKIIAARLAGDPAFREAEIEASGGGRVQ